MIRMAAERMVVLWAVMVVVQEMCAVFGETGQCGESQGFKLIPSERS